MERKNSISLCKQAIFFENRQSLAFSIIGILFKVGAGLGFSSFTQKILDTISGESVSSVQSLILFAAGCVFCLLIGAGLEYYCWTAFRSKALEQFRKYTYNKILDKNIAAFNQESAATYVSALSNDLSLIKDNYVELIPYSIELLLSFVGAIVLMLYYDVKLAGVAFVISLLPLLLSSFRMKEVERCEDRLSTANSLFIEAFAELLRGFQTVKSLKAEKQISDKMYVSNHKASEAFSYREHIEISVAYIASLSGHISQIAFFFIGLFMTRSDSNISTGVIVAFVQLMRNISQLAITMPELIAKMKAAKKLMTKNDEQLKENQESGETIPISCERSIEMRKVSYSYDSTTLSLDNISLSIPANGCYAIIGESGSGKTTMLNLFTGINRDYQGEIWYDDTEIRNVSNDSLMNLISTVYQDVFMFDASIRDNITMFGLFDEKLLEDTIIRAGLTEIVQEKGLEYQCGENGNALSGGEKQRIGIARSILHGTNVIFLDEATSALDTQTGYRIIETVQKMKGKTRIIVTHDLYPSLMEQFDSIFVLKDGKLAEQGKYNELMARKGYCYSLVNKK